MCVIITLLFLGMKNENIALEKELKMERQLAEQARSRLKCMESEYKARKENVEK